METNGNAPSQPQIGTHGQMHESGNLYGDTYSIGGMTIRQQFAMAAMQGLLANTAVTFPFGYPELIKGVAIDAVSHADALIAALNKEVPGE